MTSSEWLTTPRESVIQKKKDKKRKEFAGRVDAACRHAYRHICLAVVGSSWRRRQLNGPTVVYGIPSHLRVPGPGGPRGDASRLSGKIGARCCSRVTISASPQRSGTKSRKYGSCARDGSGSLIEYARSRERAGSTKLWTSFNGCRS
ncbi:hypothetical protein BKA81DRAFT_353342 [Phyllosticta paracitricarpa]